MSATSRRPGFTRLLGVVFLVLLLVMVWLTYAIFTKRFVDYVPVTLETSHTGLQLPMRADVKIRGVLVGEVRAISSKGEGARLDLAIEPDQAGSIPANATARLLPKTLFGEKYVALQVPAQPSSDSIAAGAVITESAVAIEVEQVLNNLYPLLRTVQPAQLNYTLTALADSLEGRGDSLGQNLAVLDSYLRRLNPQLPMLIRDLRKLGTVSDNYAAVLPEVARLLRNGVTTGSTFVEQEARIQALFGDVTALSGTTEDFLEREGDNLTRVAELGSATLPTFARYAPEFPCLTQGMVGWIPRMASAYRNQMLHINLETLPGQPTGYGPADDPEYGAQNGPHCETLPSPPYDQSNPAPQPSPGEVDDGVDQGHNKFRAPPRLAEHPGVAR